GALTFGKTWNVSDDRHPTLRAEDLWTQLTKAGVGWRAYMEGLDSRGCLDSPVPYDPGHNPFAYYGGGCPPNVVPLTRLSADLAAPPPPSAGSPPTSATTATTAAAGRPTTSSPRWCRESWPRRRGATAGCSCSRGTRTTARP